MAKKRHRSSAGRIITMLLLFAIMGCTIYGTYRMVNMCLNVPYEAPVRDEAGRAYVDSFFSFLHQKADDALANEDPEKPLSNAFFEALVATTQPQPETAPAASAP